VGDKRCKWAVKKQALMAYKDKKRRRKRIRERKEKIIKKEGI
jgi:hypothetical protein